MTATSSKRKSKNIISLVVSLVVTAAIFFGAILVGQTQTFSPQASTKRFTSDSISLNSLWGWDSFTLSVKPIKQLSAQILIDSIKRSGGSCSEINRWMDGAWDEYIDGKYSNNFNINPGEGYFIKCDKDSNLNLIGKDFTSGVVLNFTSGWNFVGIAYPKSGYMAQSLLEDINSQKGNCTDVGRWIGKWDTYVLDKYKNNFEILNNRAYFVRCEESSTFTPSL